MSITVDIDLTEFHRVFREKLLLSQRSLARNVNGTALFLANESKKNTKVANKGDIEKLGLTQVAKLTKKGKISVSKKTRKVKMEWAILNNSAWRRIYASYLYKNGMNPKKVDAATYRKNLLKGIRKRQVSVGYLAKGWNAAISKLGRAIASIETPDRQGGWGKPQGDATPARDGWNPVAVIENKAGLVSKTKSAASMNRVITVLGEGVKKAIPAAVRDMREYMQKKQKEIWNAQ